MAQVGRWLTRGRSEDGAQLVEFALVLPLLLLVMLGIAEFGFMFQRYEVVTNAAREGARLAVLPGYTDADVQARVAGLSVRAGACPQRPVRSIRPFSSQNVSIPVGGRPAADQRETRHGYLHLHLSVLERPGGVLWFDAPTVPLSAVSEMRTEAGS